MILHDVFKSRQFRRLAVIVCISLALYILYKARPNSIDSQTDFSFKGSEKILPDEFKSLRRAADKTVSEKLPVKENILFLKTHKCGTSSMVNIFYLYGVRRRLNFVMEPWHRQLNINKTLLPPRNGGHYNVQCAHTVFSPAREHKLLPKDTTLYTTVIRSPVKRFVSAFGYFGKDKAEKMDEGDNRILSLDETIMKWFEKNKDVFEPTDTTCHTDFVINGLSRDLGFNEYLKRQGPLQGKIDAFIADMKKEFDFVLLTDYFDESLVMLKELMGWEYRDIFFMKRFYTSDRSRKDEPLIDETTQLLMRYNLVDVELYNVFYQIFKLKIRDFGEEILQKKVAEFRRLRDDFENKCFHKPEDAEVFKKRQWDLTEWGKLEHACSFLHMSDITIDLQISELQTTSDFTNKEGELKVKELYKKTPMTITEKEFLLALQAAQDKIEDIL